MANVSRPGLSLIEDEYWYAGPISERKSERILSERGEAGSFLVRDSLLPEADYVLSVSSGKEIWHYDVKVSPNNECVFNNYGFSSLPDAIEFYMENRLGSVFLKEPKEPVVSPEDVSKIVATPVIKTVVAGGSLPPRTTPVSSSSRPHSSKSRPKQTTHNAIDLSKLNDHPWQGQDGSQAGYSPALSHSSTDRSQSGLNYSNASVGDEIVRSQGSSKSSRSQTSEVDPVTSYILPNNNIEAVFIKPPVNSKSMDQKENTATIDPAEVKSPQNDIHEFCETSFDSDLGEVADTKSQELTDSKNNQALPESPNTPEVVKPSAPSDKADELKKLPSISDKMKELEKKSQGEPKTTPTTTSKQKRPKSPLPPAVPKRVSSISNMKTSNSQESESEPPKTDAACPPKRLSIPEMFLEKPVEEQSSLPSPKSSGRRIEIPSSLEAMPPPPPLATHPGLAKKKEDEEREKLQAQMGKKRGGFMKLKKKNSKREKDKRKSLTEEPTLLGSEESNKKSSPTEVTSPRRLSGVPTPALSPGAVGGEGAELENKFKFITKQNWNPETFDTAPTPGGLATSDHDPRSASALTTFGHPSPSPQKQLESGPQRVSSVSSEPPTSPASPNSMTTSPTVPQTQSVDKYQSSDGIEGVSTFLPSNSSQPETSNGVQTEENGIAAVTIVTPENKNSSNCTPGLNTNGIHSENGIATTQSNSLAAIVPGVKQVNPVTKSPARSPKVKHQMPPGFMLVGPAEPLPQQYTAAQRRLPTYDYDKPKAKPAPKPAAATTSAPGPMNTKRGGAIKKNRRSLIFKK